MHQTLNHFFESDIPGEIANKITGHHALTQDLINHVYLIMYQRNDIENLAGFFAKCCYDQWYWYNSEFNRLYNTGFIELNEDITPTVEQEYSETKYQKFLRDYLEEQPKDMTDWYVRNVAKLVIQGHTYREIQRNVRIDKNYITEAIKQFKYDLFNNFEQSRDGNDPDDTPTTEH